SGWKQPARSQARPSAAPFRTQRRAVSDSSCHDIHNPLRDNNDFFWCFAVQGSFYRIQGQNGSLNVAFSRVAWYGYISSLLAVNLYRQGHGILDEEIALDLRPFLTG